MNGRLPTRMSGRQGMVFVTSAIMLVVLMSLGLGYLSMVRTELQISRNHWNALEAFVHAESAVQHSLGEILDGNDVGGNGLGNIALQDIDQDGLWDYSANYNSGTGAVVGVGFQGNGANSRTVQVTLSSQMWNGVFMVNGIGAVSNCSPSWVNGDANAIGTISSNFKSQHTFSGSYNWYENLGSGLEIPTTDTSATGPWVAYAGANTHADCSWVTPVITGVHYVSGSCTINLGGTNPLTLNGSLIVNGNLTISQVDGLIITPSGSDPALVANGAISITNVSPSSADITGLIYATGNITFTSWDFWATHSINGALVSGGTVSLNTVARTTWTFDQNLSPPYFNSSSGSGGAVTSWKGRKF